MSEQGPNGRPKPDLLKSALKRILYLRLLVFLKHCDHLIYIQHIVQKQKQMLVLKL